MRSTSSTLMAFLAAVAVPQSGAFWSAFQTKEEPNEEKLVDYAISNPAPPSRDPESVVSFGVDVSMPIQHNTISTNYAWLPHNLDPTLPVPRKYKDMPVQPMAGRQEFYDDFLNGCVEKFGSRGSRCRSTEHDRIEMSLRQPQSMQNYTALGFKKLQAPPALWKLIKDFWDKNHQHAKDEQWGVGNTYTNNWVSASKMVSVEDSKLRGGGSQLKQRIWNQAKEILQEWTGEELTQCSLYGIRIYHADAVLSTHVDRLPLVSSAIVNVAQDLDEPWPLEVIGHDGKAYNVTMEPGDMVLYESHSVLHGRPYPLKGRYFANIFIHFEPVGHSLRHHGLEFDGVDVDTKYKEALERGQGGHEHDNDGLPPYIIAGTPEESHWRQTHPKGSPKQGGATFATGSTSAHAAAQSGQVDTLHDEIKRTKDVVNAVDSNGWTPLHEGTRGGHLDVVKLLVENGADVNAKTSHGSGGTALWWAKRSLDADHEVISYLESVGAIEAGPEL